MDTMPRQIAIIIIVREQNSAAVTSQFRIVWLIQTYVACAHCTGYNLYFSSLLAFLRAAPATLSLALTQSLNFNTSTLMTATSSCCGALV